MRDALFVEVGSADDLAFCVGLDVMHIAVGADFAAAGFFGHANDRCEGARLGANLAAKVLAEAALDARAAPGARLGKNGHRRGKRMPAELACGSFEDD